MNEPMPDATMQPFIYAGGSVEDGRVPTDVTHVIVPSSIVDIEEYAFWECKQLSIVDIQASITRIRVGTFSRCSSLVSVILPPCVKCIDGYAFYGCSSLISITLPSKLVSIGAVAFYQCTSLSAIELPPTALNIATGAFIRCKNLLNGKKYDDPQFISWLKERYHNFPLHRVCHSHNITTHVIDAILRDSVQHSGTTDDLGMTALHCLLSNPRATLEMVNRLLIANPRALHIKDTKGRLPIHIACGHTHPSVTQLVFRFLNESPESAKQQNNQGKYPIHIALRNIFVTPEMINNLLAANPSSIHVKDSRDRHLIHLACDLPNAAVVDVIHTVLDKKTDLAAEKDKFGQCPIHIALRNSHMTCEMVKTLLRVSPDAEVIKDIKGQYPLHILCQNCRLATVPLIAAFVNTRTNSGLGSYVFSIPDTDYKTPIALAFDNDLSAAVKYYLYSICPISTKIKDLDWNEFKKEFIANLMGNISFYRKSDLTQHGPVQLASCDTHKNKDMVALWVRLIKDSNYCTIDDIHALKAFRDRQGRSFFSSANSEIRDAIERRSLFLGRYQIVKGVPIRSSETSIVFEAINYGGEKELDSYNDTSDTSCEEATDSRVMLKCMKDVECFNKEVEVRSKCDPQFVVQAINFHKIGKDEALSLAKNKNSLHQYTFVLVMPSGDRNLDMIHRYENLDILQLRSYAKQIANALQNLHRNRIIHGDLKLKNIVRIEGRLKIIDFGASYMLGAGSTSLISSKFSSGIFPPEMIHMISNDTEADAFHTHMKKLKHRNNSTWQKIKPKKSFDHNCQYIVKVCHEIDDMESLRDCLPYTPVQASIDIDLWAYGVCLYALYSGKSLFAVDLNDDLDSGDTMHELYCWNDREREKKLCFVTDVFARALIKKLLAKKRKDRFLSIDEMLEFNFFLSGNQRSEWNGLPTMWQYEDDLSKVARGHMRCVMAIDIANIKYLYDEVGKDAVKEVVKWYCGKLNKEAKIVANAVETVSFGGAYHVDGDMFCVLIVVHVDDGDQSPFEQMMEELTMKIASIRYRSNQDKRVPKTFLRVGSVFHCEATFVKADELHRSVVLNFQRDKSCYSKYCTLKERKNWCFSTDAANREKQTYKDANELQREDSSLIPQGEERTYEEMEREINKLKGILYHQEIVSKATSCDGFTILR